MHRTLTAFLLLLLTAAAPASQDAISVHSRSFETSDGVRLHYLDAGPANAHTIVFVPGWAMPAWIWAAQIEAFSHTYHVIAFDPRGQGESEIAASGYEPIRRGEDIGELIARLGPAPVVVVGWSLGVLDTLAYVHTHGDARIAGLVLVDNSVGEEPAPGPRKPSHAPPIAHHDFHGALRAIHVPHATKPGIPGAADRGGDAPAGAGRGEAAELPGAPAPIGGRRCIPLQSRCCTWCGRGWPGRRRTWRATIRRRSRRSSPMPGTRCSSTTRSASTR